MLHFGPARDIVKATYKPRKFKINNNKEIIIIISLLLFNNKNYYSYLLFVSKLHRIQKNPVKN